MPPLRERKHEIVRIAEELLARFAERTGKPPRLTAEAKKALTAHPWPGNVRELRNLVERAFVISEGEPIEPQHLVFDARSAPASTLPAELESIEKDRIVRTLATVDGNQTKAAALLGISRRALINRLEAYGLPRPRKHS